MSLKAIAGNIYLRRQVQQGKLDFSAYKSVSNAVAPGDLIRTHTANCEVNVTDIIVYNDAGAAAVITFYDEDSNIKLKFSIGTKETIALDLKASIKYGSHNIYARTDQAVNADITVAGREIPPKWA